MAQRGWLVPASLMFLGAMVAVGCGDDSGGAGGQTSGTVAPGPTDPPVKTPVDPTNKIDVVDNGFESDDPTGNSSSGASSGGSSGANAGSAGSSSSSSGSSPAPSAPGGDSASRAIQEADIVKLDGNRLYALSQYGGLAVVDVTDPTHLRLLGRKRTDGMPFEMYVENGRAHVMLNDFGRWVESPTTGGQWVQTSELLELDVTNPAKITEVGHYDVPGAISDSRLVGSSLYLVTFENGYCWGCNETPSTIVTSFGVGGSTVAKVDQIAFRAPDKSYSWWQRSVSATNQRLYIGGPSWNWNGGDVNRGSVIQVVDISDVGGKLKRGADVAIAGQINNRWQMDEYEGVLRVVSQYGNGWWRPNGSLNPAVQTFTVTSSASITALGETELQLPSPESLRSVRFDGPRGYAVTAQQTDPLYTIDLSVPSAPKQAAALQMPGWMFHMEPRGDRLVGFGYDQANWGGKLAVSLFDVTDLTKPAMLSRVAFGSGGSVAEDADRIHKALRVLDDQGTILVPFASYGRWDGNNCEQPASGIQIIDYAKTGLTLRGLAPNHGQPRRAMLLPGNRLLGMSDRNVTTFDISKRDQPGRLSELDLSNPAYRMVETQTHIASITNDWWSGEAMLSLTPKANADDANAVGKVSLAELAAPSQDRCSSPYGWTAWYDARLFSSGNTVWMTLPVYNYNSYDTADAGHVIVAAIDTTNPAAPRIVGRTSIPLTRSTYGYGYGYYGGCGVGMDGYGYYGAYGGYYGSVLGSGDAYVKVGSKLAYLEVATEFVDDAGKPYAPDNGSSSGGSSSGGYDPDYYKRFHWEYRRKLHVIDFADPTKLVHEDPITLPPSLGTTPLHLMGQTVLTSRWVPSTNKGKVRFYVDRVSLSGATHPLSSVNVPGSLLHVDGPSSRLVTTDYRVTKTPAADWNECDYYTRGYFDDEAKSCIRVARDFKLSDLSDAKVTLRQTYTPPSQNFYGVQLADDRIYVTHERIYDYRNYNPPAGTYYYNPPILEEGGLWAIGGLRAGKLTMASELVGGARWPLAANGTKIALYQDSGMAVFDTSTAKPKLLNEAQLRGWGYSSNVLLSQDHAVASLGEWGLQTFNW